MRRWGNLFSWGYSKGFVQFSSKLCNNQTAGDRNQLLFFSDALLFQKRISPFPPCVSTRCLKFSSSKGYTNLLDTKRCGAVLIKHDRRHKLSHNKFFLKLAAPSPIYTFNSNSDLPWNRNRYQNKQKPRSLEIKSINRISPFEIIRTDLTFIVWWNEIRRIWNAQ